jgi:hypothetical protein
VLGFTGILDGTRRQAAHFRFDISRILRGHFLHRAEPLLDPLADVQSVGAQALYPTQAVRDEKGLIGFYCG